MISPNIVAEYSVSVSPGFIFVLSENGSAISPIAYSTVLNGVGPFNYQWTITGSKITINSDTSANTSFSASGFNTSYSEVATITVTDTGNGNLETSQDVIVDIDFE